MAFEYPFPLVFEDVDSSPSSLSVPTPKRVRDFEFDHRTGKFAFANRGLTLTQTATLKAVRQAILIRLKTQRGEWYLDQSRGVPYFENILVKSPNLRTIRQVLSDEIRSVSGVASVLSVDVQLDRRARTATISFTATIQTGEVISEVVTLGRP